MAVSKIILDKRIKINMLNIIDRPEKYFTFGDGLQVMIHFNHLNSALCNVKIF